MRQPKPFFRQQTQCWMVQLDRKQHNLGPDESAAWDAYYKLMAERKAKAKAPPQSTAVGLLVRFLEWEKIHCHKPSTYEWYEAILAGTVSKKTGKRPKNRPSLIVYLTQRIGENAPVDALTIDHIEDWLRVRGFKQTARHNAIRAAKRAFNWAVKRRYIAVSPIRDLERGKPKRRDTIISPDQWAAIYAAVPASDPFHDFLTFVRETGCRPQEARTIQVHHLNRATGLIHLPADEAKGEIPRNIYLNDKALAVVTRLADLYGAGYLLRNNKGGQWAATGIASRFRRLRQKLNINGLSAYITRHTFATEALQRGLDSVVVAELMGHKDHTMVARTYQHLAKNPQFLREAARKATESPSE